jgi:hypothetical protein
MAAAPIAPGRRDDREAERAGRSGKARFPAKDVDRIHGLVVTYGNGLKSVYDPIVARMARSLRASR